MILDMGMIYASKSKEIEQREIEHAQLSRELATECVVLLENDGTLPLESCKKVALFGSGARNTVKGGTGSGDVNTRSVVNIEQGFENAGIAVMTGEWLGRQEQHSRQAKEDYLARIYKQAEEKNASPFTVMFDNPFKEPPACEITEKDVSVSDTDTAIYVISRNSGEGADRFADEGDYLPYKEELAQLRFLTAHFSKVILLLNIGGVMELGQIKDIPGISAIVLMSQLGNLGGDAICDVLLGKVTPSGKTTDTWAKRYLDYPSSEKFSHNESVHDELYEDGIYVGYRYFDSFGVEPEYCFGYGRSYTEFEVEPLRAYQDGDKVKMEIRVSNIGTQYEGKEVVQIYASMVGGKLEKPYQTLAAYAKTPLLAPQEETVLTVQVSLSALASYDVDTASWKLEAGEYLLRVGNSSKDTKAAAVLQFEEDKILTQVKNLFAQDVKLQEIHPDTTALQQRILKEISPEIQRIAIDTTALPTEIIAYQGERQPYFTDKPEGLTLDDVKAGRCTVEELVSQLTVEEMAELCVGTLREDESSVVGNASYTIPGAAGDTSSVIKDSRKVRNIILADGPAGLRLQPHFKMTDEGEMIPGGEILGDAVTQFPSDLDEEHVVDYYQYCTALPIGWALAQSWNVDLVEKAGDMVGCEMEQFGIDLWLAPAQNIHRNPLCGRNFEYFSEDPFVSGKISAAITGGVQRHPGKGTTIKHFAVNNQEDNRYFVNAHVSERALREIYLKGFEMAVKESKPLSIMTSYNLLNGTHTANHYDLLQALARDEWGFTGTIMTDWFTSQDMPQITGKYGRKYPISSSVGCIKAGNDIQMPGCQKNVDDIVEAVNTGKEIDGFAITLADLQYCTANIIRVIADM
jgi:beta-glucosidase